MNPLAPQRPHPHVGPLLGLTHQPRPASRRPLPDRPSRSPATRFDSLNQASAAPPTAESLAALTESALSAGYLAAGRATIAALQAAGPPSPQTAGLWLMGRLGAGLAVASIAHSVAAARAVAQRDPALAPWLDALSGSTVTDAMAAMRRLDGPPPLIKGATPMTLAEYHLLRDSPGPLPCRQLLAIAWLRAARTSDVLRMRAGGLWVPRPATMALELGQEKARRLGIPGYVVVHLPAAELALLRPLLQDPTTGDPPTAPPTVPPAQRRPLIPLTYAAFYAFVRAHRPEGSTVTPHSLRKGAVQRMIAAGLPLRQVALLTQHRSVPGLLAYVSNLDRTTQRALMRASRAISADAATGP